VRHSSGSRTNDGVRPQMVVHLDLAQPLVTDQKSDFRANCCGAEGPLRKLGRLCDAKAEEGDRLESRRLVTQFGNYSVL
jgi:hypothetical protein